MITMFYFVVFLLALFMRPFGDCGLVRKSSDALINRRSKTNIKRYFIILRNVSFVVLGIEYFCLSCNLQYV